MALPQGINFRATAGFVTDGANEDVDVNSSAYPWTTAQGNNVGWSTTGLTTRDRNSGNDPRLAGKHDEVAVGPINYRIDLPSAGDYSVRIAAGEANYAVVTKVELKDTTTSLGVLCSGSTGAANSFKDATDTIYTAANWPGSNAAVTNTFATTICNFAIGDGGANVCVIAHVYVEAAAGGGSILPLVARDMANITDMKDMRG